MLIKITLMINYQNRCQFLCAFIYWNNIVDFFRLIHPASFPNNSSGYVVCFDVFE